MEIAPYIDHTILKPGTTSEEVAALCMEALEFYFAAVCVPPCYVKFTRKHLRISDVKTATVIGFPFGYSSTRSKTQEIWDALNDGADELDVVINMTALKNRNWRLINDEVKACLELIHGQQKIMKLIVESGELTEDELIRCCEIVADNKVDFIKTSTGYAKTGATISAVRMMRANLPQEIFIKASGGIRNFSFAKALIDAGANRIGCSASVAIMNEQNELIRK